MPEDVKSIYPADDVRLGSDASGIFLTREGVNVFHRLAIAEALAFALLGATGDPGQASQALSECIGESVAQGWVDRVLRRWGAYLTGSHVRELDPNLFRGIDLQSYQSRHGFNREAAPAAITWLVTLACNRRCPYCFYQVTPWQADAKSSPPDATFPREAAIRMVREMGELGSGDLYLTGGEPLLRKDLPDIVEAGSNAGVRVRMYTKFLVDPGLAHKLREAGTYEITVSLDDARPKQAGALAGSSGYLGEAKATICNLLGAGLRVSANAVATRLNISHLDELVGELQDMGVPRVVISPFSLPYPVRPSASRLLPESQPLRPLVEELNRKFTNKIAVEVGSAETPEEGTSCGERMVCEVGLRTLDVLPDGRVTRCRYMWYEPNLIVGDLKEESLLEIWSGSRLQARYAPSEKLYEDTACNGCRSFAGCHERGRCFLTAKMKSSRIFGPDSYCKAEQ